jgi:hypothetical protein
MSKPLTAIAAFSVTLLSTGAVFAQAPALPPGFDPVYYSNRYQDLKKAFGNNAAALAKHWTDHGKQELRFPSLAGDATKQPYAKWKEGCEKDWWGLAPDIKYGKKKVVLNVTKHCGEADYRYAAWASSAVFYEPRSAHLRDYMRVGDWLKGGEHLQSASKSWVAAMQPDGNFCIYQNHPPGSNPLKIHGTNHWCMNPPSPGKGPFYAQMQGDGNFCVYKGTPEARTGGVKCVLTQSVGDGLFFAVLQDDRNFAIYRGTGPGDNKGYVWDRITQAPPKADTFGQAFVKAGTSAFNSVNKSMEDYQRARDSLPSPVPGVR